MPAGHHVVKVVYWPRTFTIGIVCALVSALGLMGLLVVSGPAASRGQPKAGRPVSVPYGAP